MLELNEPLLQNHYNKECSLITKQIEYFVSDISYCPQHNEIANEMSDYNFFGTLKRWFMCKSYQQLHTSITNIDEKILLTVLECETHTESNNSNCKIVKKK